MSLQKLQFRPGVNREGTNYSNEGGFYACNNIRFRSGYPEKLGGWFNQAPTYTFYGVARNLWNWVTYTSSENLLGIGTSQKFYIQNSEGSSYHDITPIRTTVTLGAAPFAVIAGSKYVTVTSAAHAIDVGTFVTFSGATAVAGLTLNGEFEIVNVIDGNSYNIIAPSAASSNTSGGGSAVSAAYQINAGSSTYSLGSGWGGGGWGGVSTSVFVGSISGTTLTVTSVTSGVIAIGQNIASGTIATGTTIVSGSGLSWVVSVSQSISSRTMYGGTTGWGSSVSVTSARQLRLWSNDNFEDNLLMNPRGGAIYYWVKNTASYPRAELLSTAANTTQETSSAGTSAGIGSTITLVDATFVNIGAVITSGANVVAGTYVTDIFGSVITLSTPTTAAATGTYTFSYAGRHVPNVTNQIVASDTNHFTIVLGANPYNPNNFSMAFDPMLVRWSDQDNPFQWVPTAYNQSGEQHLSNGSYLVCGRTTRQEILLWSDAALYSMQYLGPPYIWGFNLLMDNISIVSPNAAITVNNVTFWMGVDKFYQYSGRVETLPCSLRQFVYGNINKDQYAQIVCGSNEGYNEIWWFYASLNSDVNDTYVIYNHLERIWYYGSLSRTAWLDSPLRTNPMAAFSVQTSYLNEDLSISDTSITLLDASSYPSSGSIIIDSETIVYDGVESNTLLNCVRVTPGAATHSQYTAVNYIVPNQIMFHEYGVDDKTQATTQPIAAFIQSSDFDIGDGHQFGFVWRVLPDLNFAGSTSGNPQVKLTLKPRQNSGTAYYTADSPTVTRTSTQSDTTETFVGKFLGPSYTVNPLNAGQVYTRVRGRQMAFRMESFDAGVTWQLGAMRIDTRPDGRR